MKFRVSTIQHAQFITKENWNKNIHYQVFHIKCFHIDLFDSVFYVLNFYFSNWGDARREQFFFLILCALREIYFPQQICSYIFACHSVRIRDRLWVRRNSIHYYLVTSECRIIWMLVFIMIRDWCDRLNRIVIYTLADFVIILGPLMTEIISILTKILSISANRENTHFYFYFIYFLYSVNLRFSLSTIDSIKAFNFLYISRNYL